MVFYHPFEPILFKKSIDAVAVLNWLNTPWIQTTYPNLTGYDVLYVPFNAAEALAWFAIAVFVLIRWARYRRTRYEWVYAAAFGLFGLTDLIEMNATTPMLLMLKSACILAIISGRKTVLMNYPGAKF